MKAVLITEPGPPEVLAWRDVPDPVPGPGEVLIEVAAAGVNRADLLQRRGRYPPPAGIPAWPGLECSGVIQTLGPPRSRDGGSHEQDGRDNRWAVGDEVCALLAGGGYAAQVCVPVGQLLARPEPLDMVSAAALPEAVCTVWSNLVMTAGLRAGELVLIHGGASGIGTTAIQIARALGAHVAVTAGSAAKLARCAQLGAQTLIDYHHDDFVAQVQEASAGRGADVVLDLMGGSYLGRNLDVLATGGRLVVIATQGGSRGELDLGTLMRKRASVTGTTLRARPAAEKAAIVAEVAQHVLPMVRAGALRPVIHQVLPMHEAPQAHRVLEAGDHVGKIVLVVSGADPAAAKG